jgi:hypothetical protein
VKVDLHLHTPASSDYLESKVTYLDILRVAASRGLGIIAFTDHNTVAGYREMEEEVQELELLERLDRLQPDERKRLDEYRRMRKQVLVLPGIEFTATLGFHVLGIFSPDTDVREIEFLLRHLNVPAEMVDAGSTEVGATSDVLTAYRVIDEAGGIVIAAHVNTAHGVAMRGRGFGGQTRIAYTQDPHLHALEATDLESGDRRSTARFFDGSRPEYPRRMHCIQGSDAHRLASDPKDPNHPGVGDRVTEVLLDDVSFDALRTVFLGSDFARTRPYQAAKAPVDYIQSAREEGASIVRAFHADYTRRGGRLYAILADVCAFANTNGGTVYVGASDNAKEPAAGVSDPARAVRTIKEEVERRITPPLEVALDRQDTQGKKVVRVVVPRGSDPPYAIDDNKIYVRSESETGLAVRDEIVNLVMRSIHLPASASVEELTYHVEPPRTGVEVIHSEKRTDTLYHELRDLRNGNIVKNVTRQSARRLWHYAITQVETSPPDADKVDWHGDIGVLRRREHRGKTRYDLVQRDGGRMRCYYGVTDDGIHGVWAQLVGLDEDA